MSLQRPLDNEVGPAFDPEALPMMIDVNGLSEMLGCSTRHTYRLANAGRIPKAIKLGSLVRWPGAAIKKWLENECKNSGGAQE